MPAYILERSHGPAVKDGRQRMTLAAPRSTGPAHAHATLGQTVQIDLAKAGDKPRARIAEGVCILRATVTITADSLIRITDVVFHERGEHTAAAERLVRCLRAAEQGAPRADKMTRDTVARLAGFRDWKRLWEWNSHRDRRGRPDASGQVTRELIGWA